MIIDDAKNMQKHLVELREDFHRHPEISCQEKETAARIVKELQAIGGYKISENVYGYGILAEIKGPKEGKTIALRADMDALQIVEETGLPFVSENHGVMHACGHDCHMTVLLGAARLLQERQAEICGTVRLIFQPAEEKNPTGGAQGMIAAGALDGVDAIFGMHVWPDLPAGAIGMKAGPIMAASDHFSITMHGKSCHAAQPDAGIDTVVAGAQFVTAVQTVVSRNVSPLKAAVITIGSFYAGSRYNILAEECEIEGTCRTYEPSVRKLVEERLRKILDGICIGMGTTYDLQYDHGYMATINDPAMAAYFTKTVETTLGKTAAVTVEAPSMCSEDFAYYLMEKPGAFGWLGVGNRESVNYPLHSSKLCVDEEALWQGAVALAAVALKFK